MTIRSVAELEALPIGGAIQISGDINQVWERVTQGMMRDGQTLAFSMFGPAVQSGQVEAFDNTIMPGDYFRHERYGDAYCYLIIARDGDLIHALLFQYNTFNSYVRIRRADLRQYTKTTSLPDFHALAMSLGTVLVTTSAGQPVVQQGLVDDLHQITVTVHEERPDLGDRLDEMLDTHGISRKADHECLVTITGKTKIALEPNLVADQMGLGFEVSADKPFEFETDFTKQVTIVKRGLGCVCNEVTQEDVAAQMPEVTGEWTWTVSHAEEAKPRRARKTAASRAA